MKLTLRIPDRHVPSGPRVPLSPVTALEQSVRLAEGLDSSSPRRQSQCEDPSRPKVSRRMSLFTPQEAKPPRSTNDLHRTASLRTQRDSQTRVSQPRDLIFAHQARKGRHGHSPSPQNHRLPVEILAEIFLRCIPADDAPPTCLAREAPLVLVSICREWRLVALNMPRLWCFPRFRLPRGPSVENLERHRMGMEVWLKRSESLPLCLSLCPTRSGNEMRISREEWLEPNHSAFKLLRSLLQHCYRIVELTVFSLRGMHDLLRYMSITKIRLPALQSIYIRATDEKHSEFHDRLLSDLMTQSQSTMPGLQKISIDGLSPDTARYLNRTRSWSPKVTHLILGSPPSSRRCSSHSQRLGPAHLLSILSKNPQLRSFEGVVALNSLNSIQRTPVDLPALQNLKIRFEVPSNDAFTRYPDPDILQLFSCMSCPSLKTLSLAYAGLPSLVEVPFTPWLRSSDGFPTAGLDKLRKLTLELSMTPDALTDCLRLLPSSLRVLEIVDLGQMSDTEGEGVMFGHTVQDSHLDLLTRHPPTKSAGGHDGTRNVCPRLKTFRLTVSGFLALGPPMVSPVQKQGQGISRETLQRFVDSRLSKNLNGADTTSGHSGKLRECEVLLSPSSSSYYKFF